MELSQLLAPGELTGGVNRPTRWVGSRNTRPLDAAVAERQLSGLREWRQWPSFWDWSYGRSRRAAVAKMAAL